MKQMEKQAESVFSVEVEKAKENGLIFGPLYERLTCNKDLLQQAQIMQLFEAYQKEPFKKKRIRCQIEEIVNFDESYQPSDEELQEMDLVDLYHVRKSLLDDDFRGLTGKMRAIADCLKLKGFLLKMVIEFRNKIKNLTDIRTFQQLNADFCNQTIVPGFDRLGLHFEVDYNGFDPEEIISNPHIVYMNHQGSGLETYTLPAALYPGNKIGGMHRNLTKLNLKNTPFFGIITQKSGAIYINRKNLREESSRQVELKNLASSMSSALEEGSNLVIFIDGTRSTDGNFAGSPKRLEWAKDMNGAVDQAIDRKPVKKILLLVDSLLGFPSPIEDPKKILDKDFRKNAGVKYKFFHLPENLSYEDNPENPYDTSNFFGFARSQLADMQRAEIKKILDDYDIIAAL